MQFLWWLLRCILQTMTINWASVLSISTVIRFVEYVCLYVCIYVRWRKKLNMISVRDITGVASHGKHTRATEHVKKLGNKIGQNFPLSKIWAPKLPRKRLWQFCRADQIFLAENFRFNFVPQFFHMFGDFRVCLPWQCYPKESWLNLDYQSLAHTIDYSLVTYVVHRRLLACGFARASRGS